MSATTHLSLLWLLLLIHSAYALPEFVMLIPNGDAAAREDSGIICAHLGHEMCVSGAPRNQFGLDFAAQGLEWTRELCMTDSDGDGLTNGEELGDPCCEWTVANQIPLRQTMLSHPGVLGEDGAREAPGCRTAITPSPAILPGALPDATMPAATMPADTMPAETMPAETVPSATMQPTPAGTPVGITPSPAETASPNESANNENDDDDNDDDNDDDDDDDECFPAKATVRLEDGSVRTMDQLKVGDSVQVGPNEYSKVFMFTHKLSGTPHQFVTLRTSSPEREASVSLTRGHFLYVNGELSTAASVKIGDELELHDGSKTRVVAVSSGEHEGLFNPQTMHGDLIVDSIRVSTYTTAVEKRAAHSLLLPLRAMYGMFGWSMSAFESGADRILGLLR